jgi:large subunit ribosomal protein L15
VNLADLDRFTAGTKVDARSLAEAGLIRHVERPVKLLGRGQVANSLQIEVTRASQAAVAAVEAAGGTVTCLE